MLLKLAIEELNSTDSFHYNLTKSVRKPWKMKDGDRSAIVDSLNKRCRNMEISGLGDWGQDSYQEKWARTLHQSPSVASLVTQGRMPRPRDNMNGRIGITRSIAITRRYRTGQNRDFWSQRRMVGRLAREASRNPASIAFRSVPGDPWEDAKATWVRKWVKRAHKVNHYQLTVSEILISCGAWSFFLSNLSGILLFLFCNEGGDEEMC